MALGILCAYYVSWLHQDLFHYTEAILLIIFKTYVNSSEAKTRLAVNQLW
jgi:hypothetical protein